MQRHPPLAASPFRVLGPVVALLVAAAPGWVARHHPDTGDALPAAVAVDTAGNVYVAAAVTGSGGTDFLTIKYDAGGRRQWVRTFDGPAGGEDYPADIETDTLGRVYVTGTFQGGTGPGYGTVCYTADGNEAWSAYFDSPAQADDHAVAVAPDNNGNCFVTGRSYAGPDNGDNIVTLFYDSTGRQRWDRSYNGPGRDEDYPVDAATDNAGYCYVAGASTGLRDTVDFVTLEYSGSGMLSWIARARAGRSAVPRDLDFDRGGNIYLTGSADYGPATGWDAFTVRYNRDHSDGWTMRHNGPGSPDEHGLALSTNLDTTVFVATLTFSGGETRLGVTGITRYGSLLNAVTRPVAGDSAWSAGAVYSLPTEGFVLVGSARDDSLGWGFLAVGYDHLWEPAWQVRYDGPGMDDVLTGSTRDRHGNFYLVGRSQAESGSWDAVTVKESTSGPGIAHRAGLRPEPVLRAIPNPARHAFTLRAPGWATPSARLLLTDAAGRTVRALAPGTRTVVASDLAPGVYFLVLRDGNRSARARVTLTR